MAAAGAIRKRGAKATAARAVAAPLLAPDGVSFPAPEDPTRPSAPESAPAVPSITRAALLVALEDDRRDNARNHERALAKRMTHEEVAHLAVVRYIERLKERIAGGEL